MRLIDHIDVAIAKLMIWRIREGYGADCETRDVDDYCNTALNPERRCPSCKAAEIIDWLEDHIEDTKDGMFEPL